MSEKDQVQVTSKVPRILCELFVYGTEEQKPIIKENLDELQKQFNKARRNKNKIRVCFYIDKGEKTVAEKLEWFKENGKCKYFIALEGIKPIKKGFVSEVMGKIRTFENSFNSLKASNILMFGRNEESSASLEEAEILEID